MGNRGFGGHLVVRSDDDLRRLAKMINETYYNLPLKNAIFHKQYSTWGTCSLKTRQIYVSHRLKGAPLELIWYVLTHEICHLEERSHNARYWNLVSKACPDYINCRKMLKAYAMQNYAKEGYR